MGKQFEIVKKETVYNGFFKMLRYRVKHALYAGGTSNEYTRELLDRGHGVHVLLHDPVRNEIVLVEQFRIGAIESKNPWMIELVAGIIEPGESPEDVARREAKEECGAIVGDLTLIADFYNSAGGSSETALIYYAEIDSTNVDGIHGLPSENEDIKVIKLSVYDFINKLDSNLFNAASLVVAGYWFKSQFNL